MKELLVHLRAMQLFAQNAHHLVGRVPFFQDHDFFGDAYDQHASDYDSVAERIVGLFGEEQLALSGILQEVYAKLHKAPSVGVSENSAFFIYQLQLEKELCQKIAEVCAAGASEGTKQLIGDIADKSEARQYKIQRRIKK